MLFFKAKKKEAGRAEEPASVARAPRYGSLALVGINGYEGMAVLRNVSESGFRMESKTFVEMDLGGVYTIRISPEISSGVKQFELKVETRWIQSSQDKFTAGFMVVDGGNHSFQRYVDFLRDSSRVV
ncbi:MAG: hypothetical protein LBO76_05295 [Treponema sp.]|jgi:hypothetical protein|nr:hypothetical protein [Treponema sp.]